VLKKTCPCGAAAEYYLLKTKTRPTAWAHEHFTPTIVLTHLVNNTDQKSKF